MENKSGSKGGDDVDWKEGRDAERKIIHCLGTYFGGRVHRA